MAGTSFFIANVLSRGAKVVFFSSDTVYGELVDEFDESEPSNPLGEYANMKYQVEKLFALHPNFKSIRLSYVFSGQDKFSKYLINCAESKNDAELFHPFYRSVICLEDVVQGIVKLVENWKDVSVQNINFGGPDLLSRVDIAEAMKRNYSSDLTYKVVLPNDSFFKNRPKSIAMKSPILTSLIGDKLRSIFNDKDSKISFVKNKGN